MPSTSSTASAKRWQAFRRRDPINGRSTSSTPLARRTPDDTMRTGWTRWSSTRRSVPERVLQKDTGNYRANYNLATLYYNHGVYNIQQLGVDNDLLSIELIQQVSKELFKRALPYMLKAHQMRPDRKETLLGLEGIYYSLQDDERSEEFRTVRGPSTGQRIVPMASRFRMTIGRKDRDGLRPVHLLRPAGGGPDQQDA